MASISLNLTQKDLEEAVLAYAKAKGFEVTERARVSFTVGRWLMLVLGEGLVIFLNEVWISLTQGKKDVS